MIDVSALDWDDIRVFLEAARTGGVAAAARGLELSQATVGRRLRRLESALRSRLFDRLPNRLSLTRAGEELLASAEAMRDGATALARRAAAQAITTGAPVRISATNSVSLFLAGHMRELLQATTQSRPEIPVLSTRTAADLARGEAEIALRMRRAPEHGALTARRVGKLAFAVYAERGYWATRERVDSWETVGVVGLPETPRMPSQSRWLDDAMSARGATTRLRLGEVCLRYRAVRDGLGASLLPCFLGDADRGLVRVLEPPTALAEDIYLLVHDDMRNAAPVRNVADAVIHLFKRARSELGGLSCARRRQSVAPAEPAPDLAPTQPGV